MKLRQQYTFWHIQFEMLSVMAVFQIILCLIVYHCHFFCDVFVFYSRRSGLCFSSHGCISCNPYFSLATSKYELSLRGTVPPSRGLRACRCRLSQKLLCRPLFCIRFRAISAVRGFQLSPMATVAVQSLRRARVCGRHTCRCV